MRLGPLNPNNFDPHNDDQMACLFWCLTIGWLLCVILVMRGAW